jgi:hypothetical protein
MKKIVSGVSWIATMVTLALAPAAIAHADSNGHERIGTAWSCRHVNQGFECKEA